jgi:hypothetical protein
MLHPSVSMHMTIFASSASLSRPKVHVCLRIIGCMQCINITLLSTVSPSAVPVCPARSVFPPRLPPLSLFQTLLTLAVGTYLTRFSQGHTSFTPSLSSFCHNFNLLFQVQPVCRCRSNTHATPHYFLLRLPLKTSWKILFWMVSLARAVSLNLKSVSGQKKMVFFAR